MFAKKVNHKMTDRGYRIFICLLIFILFLNIFVFQVTAVSGDSMRQTLHNDDVYIISKIGNALQLYPDYGDVVVIDSRVSQKRTVLTAIADMYRYNIIKKLITGGEPGDMWVKRVIGLPGDRLYMSDGIVYRNGELLDEIYVNADEMPRYYNDEYIVPEGHIFVMGDNRNHSSDSRRIGAIPIENVIGTVKIKIKSGD